MANGLSMSVIMMANDIEVRMSGFLYTILAKIIKIPMILALTIEPVNPTMNKKKIRIKIITEYEIFLGKLLLERINNTPKMIYDM